MNNSKRWTKLVKWFLNQCICSGGVRTKNMGEYGEGMCYMYHKINVKIEELKNNKEKT